MKKISSKDETWTYWEIVSVKLNKEEYSESLHYKHYRDDNSCIMKNFFYSTSFKLCKFSWARNTKAQSGLFWLKQYEKYKYSTSDDQKSEENVREAHMKNYREERGLYAKLRKFQRE